MSEELDLDPSPHHGLSDRLARSRRRGLEPQERQRIMDAVALRTRPGWRFQFGLLQLLSVTVAVMGLSTGSPAIVIGAMLLAPLMVPVLGVGAAVAMGLPKHLGRAAGTVVVASIASVVLAALLSLVLPSGPLTSEVLARTSPDLRDLVVALAAGTAGAYATVRTDVSTALPGVAVAVALVPPLATIGITLEAGRLDLATGALLLYLANLTGIILVGIIVFVATGFVPPQRLRQARFRVSGGALAVAAVTLIVTAPLALASAGASESGRKRDRVTTAVEGWISGSGDELDEVRIDGDVVRVRVSGPNPPPPTGDLERAVQQILEPAAVVEVRWTQTQIPPAVDDPPSGEVAESDADRRDAAVSDVVERWLDDDGLGDKLAVFDIDRLDVGDSSIRLDLISAVPPPPLDDLTTALRDELGLTVPVIVNWTQRTTLAPTGESAGEDGEDAEAASIDRVRRDLDAVARRWAAGVEATEVLALTYDGVRVVVDLVGPEPVDVSELDAELAALVPADTTITIWFSERRRLSPTTTTTTTTVPADGATDDAEAASGGDAGDDP